MTALFSRTAWLLVPLLAVAGCAQAATADPPAKTPALAAPFGGLLDSSPAESGRLQLAQNTLTASCMRARSYYFHVGRPPSPSGAAENAYGLVSAATAARQGYGVADNFVVNSQDDVTAGLPQPDAHRAGFMDALTGTASASTHIPLPGGSEISYDANGCVTVAINELYGPEWNKVYYTVNALGLRVVSAGLAGVTGRALPHRLASLRAAEVKLAGADARCQAGTGLAAAAWRAQAVAEQPYEREYASDLKAYAAAQRHAVKVAGALLK